MLDSEIRLKAFEWLDHQVQLYGDVLSSKLLQTGFLYKNSSISLFAPSGIFKPRIMDLPLTIRTSTDNPYDDHLIEDNVLYYSYQGTEPFYRDNVWLRQIFEKRLPLIYLRGIVPGKYLVAYPVYVIEDDPANLRFKIVIDKKVTKNNLGEVAESSDARKEYLTSVFKARVHQRSFREKVLRAYRSQCSLCRLKHVELLDAAHILPDSDPISQPTIDNGIALCKFHHAAFDRFIIGINPDYKIVVRKDILDEKDGPMLKHGLKELHGMKIILPSLKTYHPNRDFLNIRFKRFLDAG